MVGRVSKGVGLPAALPDIAGVASGCRRLCRRPHHGMLLASTAGGALGRVLLRPMTSWPGATFSSLMPLGFRGGVWWVRARLATAIDAPGLSLDTFTDQISRGGIDFSIEQAAGTGDFRPLAQLSLNDILPPGRDMAFDPDPAHRTRCQVTARLAGRFPSGRVPTQPAGSRRRVTRRFRDVLAW